MTKEELKLFCDTELQNIDRIAGEISSIFIPEKSDYSIAERAAIGAFTINIYRGVENILKQILIFDKLDVKDSPEWHEKVLKKASEMGILPPDLFQIFTQYLSFRNHFIYTDIFNIKWEELKMMLTTMKKVLERFSSEVYEYLQTI